MRVEPYLYFHGRCEEALNSQAPNEEPGKVAHAVLRIGDTTVLASDAAGGGQASFDGFSLSLTVSDDAEADRMFASLADGGNIQLPMTSTPFASRLGLVADRFGVPWMVTTPTGA
ncbi:MAG: VOC family protein [Mycobacterium sp.]